MSTLARPIAPVAPNQNCAQVYSLMASDETLFALPIVEGETPVGLIDRVTLMSQFARPYWREIYSPRPITKLMDAAPVIVDVAATANVICRNLAGKRAALNTAFILVRDGRYHGVGSTIDLLQLIADAAQQHAHELSFAQAEIRAFNETLERRVIERTEQLEAAQQQIVRKERLSALGQLTATVAHELRNPLSSIRNTVFTIKEALVGRAADFTRPLGRIERSIERCDGIISDLLDYTRSHELNLRPVAADAWLDEVLTEMQIPDGIALARDFDAGRIRLAIDSERMRRVVINLVENAVQATADIAGKRRIVVATRALGETYELTIDDSGPGIPEDVLPKIFDPLFSTKSFGTGLGLPTVKQIVEQHGGSVAIANAPHGGARALVRLHPVERGEIAA
ncbi:MAG TPA: ATP-binding protein [Stellaceae bacterium]